MFQDVAMANPSLPAITTPSETLSYAELNVWSNNLAQHLANRGAHKGSITYIAANSSFSVVASMLAALKLGAVFVPVDPHAPPARLRALTGEVPPDFILVEYIPGSAVDDLLDASIPVVIIDGGDGEGQIKTRLGNHGLLTETSAPDSVSGPDDMCYVYFTSGSTGKPKAIAGRLKAIDHFVRWEAEEFGVKQGTAVSQLASPFFDAFLRDAFTPLCFGGVVRATDNRQMILDAKQLVRWMNESEVELVHSIPSIFRTLLGEPLTARDFPKLRTVALAGELLLASDVRRWREIFDDRIRLVNLYGASETTMVKLFHDVRAEDIERISIPIGKAIPGARALVLDEAGHPTAEGAVGEIFIRTPYRSLGYYGKPDLTDEVFVPNPLSGDPNDVVYKSGDLGRMMEDGSLEYLGRRDQQVKVRGVRIEIAEIEDAILNTGAVAEAAVTARTDMIGNSYLCAYIVSKNGSARDEVQAKLALIMPDYMLPSSYLEVERLPRTTTGKVDRSALPSPEELLDKDHAYVEPRNETEAEAAKLFAEVLGLEQVGVHDDFFKLGGHSLLAMTLLSSLISKFEIDLPLASLFEHPTVAEIAPLIQKLQAEGRFEGYQPLGTQVTLDEELETRVNSMSDEEVDALLHDILAERTTGAEL
jgi:amino acid adenylation domain-containing protein